MQNFLSNIIEQSNMILGVVSVVITIGLAIIQERRKSKELDKETIRLTDEIVMIIIRNCLSNISIKHVDLNILIEGFGKIRNGCLKYNAKTIMTMVYAKVYENDHLSEMDKKSLLTEIEYELRTIDEVINKKTSNSDSGSVTLPAAITIGTMALIFYTLENALDLSSTNLNDLNVLVIIALILTTVIFVPVFSNYTARIISKFENNNEVEMKKSIYSKIKVSGRKLDNRNKNLNEVDNNIKISTYIENEDKFLKCLKNRYLIENLLAELCYKTNKDTNREKSVKRLGARRMISLIDSEILTEEFKSEIYILIKELNVLAHEYGDTKDMNEEIDLIIHKSDVIINQLIEKLG